MARNVPKSIDYYGIFLTESMASWSSEQHVAWAAAVAQRWLPSYESFSYNEDWGDPASLRRSLEAVWSHVAGRMLSPSHAAQHIQQIDDVTPYMDDFDAEDALIACALLKDALRACGEPDNSLRMVSQMAMAMLEFLLEQQEDEDTPPSRAWKSASVRSEVRAQMKLVDEIGRVTEFDAQAVRRIASPPRRTCRRPSRAFQAVGLAGAYQPGRVRAISPHRRARLEVKQDGHVHGRRQRDCLRHAACWRMGPPLRAASQGHRWRVVRQ